MRAKCLKGEKIFINIRKNVSTVANSFDVTRLPFISKRLEEHLYRSAQTKEEYLDPNTLKKRLQMIAQGLEVHRSSSSGSKKDNPNRSDFALSTGVLTNSSLEGPDVGGLSTDFSAGSDTQNQQLRLQEQMNQIKQLQQLQQIQQHQQFATSSTNLESILKQQSLKEDMMNQTGKSGNLSASPSLTSLSNAPGKVNNTTDMNSLSQLQQDMRSQQTVSKSSVQGKASQGILKTGNSKYQDSHKRTVVKQQQERLLLLRHASKCKAGNDCKVRFCGQMVSLWKHMKKCRDKNCKTAHCLSSRCVLNHYRICKNENRTSVCEVCGPVMRQIKQQNNQVDDDDSSTQNKSIMPTQNDIQNTQSEFVSGKSFVMSNVNINSEISEKDGIEDIQLTQDKLHQQHMLLKELQNQQAQLLQQHKQLEQQQGPGLPQQQPGNELQQQLFLLEQLQQEFQQRQKMYLIQKSNVITNSNGMMNNSQISPGPSPLLDSDSLMASMSDNSNAHGLNNPELSIGISREIDDLNFTENNENITFNGNSIDVGKALDSSLSSSSIASTYNLPKTVVRRGSASKGKQLSALESTIHHSNDSDNDLIRNAAMEAGIGVSSAYDGASAKRHKSNDQNFDGKTNLLSPDNAIGSTEDTSLVDSHEKNSKDVDPGVISPSSPQASRDSLEGQIQSKLTASAISQKYLPILRRLIDDKFGWVFRDAVDPVVLGLPDYFDVVKTPMHLSLVEQKLESFSYEDSYAVEKDIKLVFENAMLYNGAESDVGGMALKMIQIFEEEIKCFSSGKKLVLPLL
jgi:Bromodomain/TAZ zinc finger